MFETKYKHRFGEDSIYCESEKDAHLMAGGLVAAFIHELPESSRGPVIEALDREDYLSAAEAFGKAHPSEESIAVLEYGVVSSRDLMNARLDIDRVVKSWKERSDK